jgi:hypothetical protein
VIQEGLDLVQIGLKSSPFLFTIALQLFSKTFYDEWDEDSSHYFNQIDIDWGDLDPERQVKWHFHQFSTYLHHKVQIKYSLALSAFYAVLLHLLAIYHSSNWNLVIPLLLFLLLIPFFWFGAERWFSIESAKRTPNRYFSYYRKKKSTEPLRQSFKNPFLPTEYDRWLNPTKYAFFVESLLILIVIILEWPSFRYDVIVVSIIVVLIFLIGYLITPGFRHL